MTLLSMLRRLRLARLPAPLVLGLLVSTAAAAKVSDDLQEKEQPDQTSPVSPARVRQALSPVEFALRTWHTTKESLAREALELADREQDEGLARSAHLALAKLALDESELGEAEKQLAMAAKRKDESLVLDSLEALLGSGLLLEQAQPSLAYQGLRGSFLGIRGYFPERGARLLLKAQIDAAEPTSALATLRANPGIFINKDGSRVDSRLQLELARQTWSAKAPSHQEKESDIEAQGGLLMAELAKRYPIDDVSIEAFGEFERKMGEGRVEFLWPSPVARREHATKVLQSLGAEGSHRGFAFRLAGTEAKQADRQLGQSYPARVEEESLETLRVPDRESLEEDIAVVEWLISVREYEEAHPRIETIYRLRDKLPEDMRPKVIFLAARSANAVNESERAAGRYKELYTFYPRSSLAADARERYVKTLHYSQRHMEVVQALGSLGRQDRRLARRLAWLGFWSHYLEARRLESEDPNQSKAQYGKAEAALVRLRSANRSAALKPKFEYWQGRLYEKRGQRGKAKERYQVLANWGEATVYSIYSRWRLGQLSQGFDRSQALVLAAASLRGKGPEREPTSISQSEAAACGPHAADIHRLARVGLWDFARSLMGHTSGALPKGRALLPCASLAHLAHDHNRASGLARRALGSQWKRDEKPYAQKIETYFAYKRLDYPEAYREVVLPLASQLEVEPALVYAVMRAESSYEPAVTSWVGARGLMQIMPQTGERIARIIGFDDYHPDKLYEPKVNVAMGTWYLKRLLDYYRGDLMRAVAAYNAGPVAVDRWREQIPYLEIDEFAENIHFIQTNGYVKKVLSYMDTYIRLGRQEEGGLLVSFGPDLPDPVDGLEVF